MQLLSFGAAAFCVIALVHCAARSGAVAASSSDRCDTSPGSGPVFPDYSVTERARPIRSDNGFVLRKPPSEGEVFELSLRFIVDTLGRVERCSTEIVHESPRGFGERFITALRTWRFTPAIRYGEKVRMSTLMHIRIGPGAQAHAQIGLDTLSRH